MITMRKKARTAVILITILAAVAVIAAVTLSKLHRRTTVMTQPQDFLRITMIDEKTGWVLAKNGQIYRTENGGTAWIKASSFRPGLAATSIAILDTCFPDDRTAFAAVNTGTVQKPTIVVFRTEDQGKTWSSTPITPRLDWERDDIGGARISFADVSNGYLLITGTPGAGQMGKTLYRTTDGGKTFSFVGDITGKSNVKGTSTGIEGYPDGMAFSTSKLGFITCPAGAWAYLLTFRTTDGGVTWLPASLPVPAAYKSLSYSNDYLVDPCAPVFFGAQKNNGVIMLDYFSQDKHVLQSYHTTDSGASWTLGPVSNNAGIATYSFISATTGWGLDANGKLLTTMDGGATWTALVP